jgi:dihydrofolate reductase
MWDNTKLAKGNLVDEFHLIINPVVLGAGLSPFKEINSPAEEVIDHQVDHSREVTEVVKERDLDLPRLIYYISSDKHILA